MAVDHQAGVQILHNPNSPALVIFPGETKENYMRFQAKTSVKTPGWNINSID